jgi:hypothetical protein
MDVGWSVLDASLFCGNKHFNVFGCFVVKLMQERFEAVESEPCTDLAICKEKLFFWAFLDGNRANCNRIEDLEDNNICLAAVGCDGKAVDLIGEEVAIDLLDGHENKMCVRVVGFLRDIFHGVIDNVWHTNWLGCWVGKTRLGGSDTLAILIHVSHLWFCGDRDVAACLL